MTLETLSFVILWIGVVLMSASSAFLIYSQYVNCPAKKYRTFRTGKVCMDFAGLAVGCAILVNAIYHIG